MSERSIICMVALTLFSCTGAQYTERADEVVDVPATYADLEMGTAPPLQNWCSDFGSSELSGLVDSAFQENLDMRQAWSRLEQAEAVAKLSRATLFPAISADLNAGAQRQTALELAPDPSGMGPPEVVTTTEIGTSYRASLGAAYEVDLWGRLAAQRRAAGYDLQAARADVESIAITITSQVAEAWFDVVAQREKMALLEEQIEIATKYRELTQLRLSQGVATALDVNQQDQQIEGLRGQLELVRGLEATAYSRLSVLMGKAPGAQGVPAVAAVELPELPPLPGAGAPGDLLERRPDVRAAHLRLRGADARTAAAARDKLPKLNLSAAVFLQSGEIAEFFDNVFWSITAAASQSVWQGGRKDAAQQQAEAAARERLWAYARTVVQAIADVYNALVLERSQEKFLAHLQAQHEKASIALELARERYRAGSLGLPACADVASIRSAARAVAGRRSPSSTLPSRHTVSGARWLLDAGSRRARTNFWGRAMSRLPKFVIVFIIPLLVVGSGVAVAAKLASSREEPKREETVNRGTLVEVQPIERTTQTVEVEAKGTVRAAKRLVVQPQLSGEITRVHDQLVPGGLIKQGDVLFRIRATDYKIAVDQRETSVAQAQAQLRIEEGQQRVARKEWELFQSGNQDQAADPGLALRAPQKRVAEVSLDAAMSQLEMAKVNLSRTTVRAPFNLMVENENVEVGQVVGPGSPAASVVGTDKFWVQVSVPIDRLEFIQIPAVNAQEGSAVTIEQDIGRQKVTRPGRVVRLLGELDPVGRMARVLVEIDDPLNLSAGEDAQARGLPFLLGSFVTVRFDGAREMEVSEIPRSALHEGDKVYIFNDGKLDIREVSVVWRRENTVLVADGVTSGEQLVTSRIAAPLPGMKLRVPAEGDK